MYWEEKTDEKQYIVPDDVVDLSFKIDCPTLPVDHAWPLSQAIIERLPWFESDAHSGLHIIHGADSGNGWERPQGSDDLLHLSRRTRLMLRVPKQRIADASTLSGIELTIAGHTMIIGEAKSRKLAMTSILYSRYVVCDANWDEERFMQWAVSELKKKRIHFKKALSGKTAELATPDGPLYTRTLMVAEMPIEDAVALQEEGIGPYRARGCGLFIPQKSF
ncbi:MAG: type I-MYXAN CRISPR-associated protein Cas6/Cmx6 [Chromatiales bacterium]|nr:type I-MYXAN CRISPR-associated protein Cas6/Cmx6 [Chromatiales bacterium]